MRIVFRCFIKEILTVCQMMFRRRCCSGERRFYPSGMCQLQCAIYFIGGNVIETFAFIPFRQTFPINLGSLQQGKSSHHVGTGKGKWILDAPVHMAFGCQVDDTINTILPHQSLHFFKIADVGFYKCIIRLVLNIFQVSQITCISQFVKIDNVIVRIFVHK